MFLARLAAAARVGGAVTRRSLTTVATTQSSLLGGMRTHHVSTISAVRVGIAPASRTAAMLMSTYEREHDGNNEDYRGGDNNNNNQRQGGNNNRRNNSNNNQNRGTFTRRTVDPAERQRAIESGLCLYINNLAHSVTWQRLKDLFETVGQVKNARVATFPDKSSRGFGFVEFYDAEVAQRAIQELNGSALDGQEIGVQLQTVPTQKSGVFVSSIPWSVTTEELAEVFSPLEGFVNARVMLDFEGRSRGMAVVNFATPEQRDACISKMDGFELQGRQIRVRETQNRSRGDDRNSNNNNNNNNN